MAKVRVGQQGHFYKTLSEYDIYGFAGISGDLNRFHVDEMYAQETFFKHRIAHGVLLLSFVSTVLGTQAPGPGTILTSLETKFLRPAYIGDTIKASAEITGIEGNKVEVAFNCSNQDRAILIEGTARVTVPKDKT